MDFQTAAAQGFANPPAATAPAQPSAAAPAASPAPQSGPAPAADPAQKLREAFAAPQAPAQPSPAAPPAAPQTPPSTPQTPAQPTPPQAPEGLAELQQRLAEGQKYRAQLENENAKFREELAKGQQAAIDKMTAAVERMAEIQQSKALTPEEKKAKLDAEFAEINSGSPKDTIRKWVAEDIDGLKQTIKNLEAQLAKQAETTTRVDRYATRNENLMRLHTSGKQEVADPGFSNLMFSAENVSEVQKSYYGTATDAKQVYEDPRFYDLLYANAKLLATKGFQPVINQSQADKAGVGAAAAAAPQPSGHQPAGAVPPTEDYATSLKKQLLTGHKTFSQALAEHQSRT